MLLIDGVRYELWTPPNEDEFEKAVVEHASDIFGESCIYFDRKQRLKSLAGIGSIPDGYAVVLGDPPEWHIVEVELSSHPLHEHVVSQVSRFITGISNPSTQRELAAALHQEIGRDGFLRLKLERTIGSGEVYKFLADLVARPPVLTIIIEKDTRGLREAVGTLAHSQIEIVEFQTFTRQGVGLGAHAHSFAPLASAQPPQPVNQVAPRDAARPDTLGITVRNPSFRKFNLISIPKENRRFFPGYKVPFALETDVGTVQTQVTSDVEGTTIGDPDGGRYVQGNLSNWYRAHPEMKVGSRVIFTVIEPMKKYRLEIVRQ